MSTTALPSSWSFKTLGELFDFKGGGTPSKKNSAYWGGDIPWASVKDIKEKYLSKTIDSITREGLAGSAANLAEQGDLVLITRIYPGKAAIASRTIAINQDCKVARPRAGVDAHWAYYLFLANEREFIKRSSGTTVLGISLNDVKEISVPVPPLKDQKRIVAKIDELFSELDNGIAALKTTHEQLKVYRQAILKHAFEGKLTAQWREENKDKLETPEQLLARVQQEREARYQQQLEEWKQAVKDWEAGGKEGKKPGKPKVIMSLNQLSDDELSELPELPKEYIYTYLSNVGELGRGKSKHRPRNDPKLFGGKYPFIQTAEVKAANRVIKEFSQTYSDFGLAQSKLWPAGTLCITIAANIAETSILGFDGCFPDSVVGFASHGAVLSEYVELFIKAARMRIEAYAPATAQKNINLTTLENLVIPYCSINEQRRIIDELESIFYVINTNENEIELALKRAEILRQSILKKAFSGQLNEGH